MNNQIEILIVDDSPADIRLIKEALKDARVYNTLHVSEDGQAAIDFLDCDPAVNPDKIRPGLILLDLYMPRVNGLEVLKHIKTSPTLKSIPVVVMTSSVEEVDVAKAYELQANCYIIKPLDFEQLTTVVKSIEDFWLSLVHLPRT